MAVTWIFVMLLHVDTCVHLYGCDCWIFVMLLHVGTSLEQTYIITSYWYICVLNIDMYFGYYID